MQCCWGLGARAFLAAVCDGYVHVLCCMQHVLYCMQSVCIQQKHVHVCTCVHVPCAINTHLGAAACGGVLAAAVQHSTVLAGARRAVPHRVHTHQPRDQRREEGRS